MNQTDKILSIIQDIIDLKYSEMTLYDGICVAENVDKREYVSSLANIIHKWLIHEACSYSNAENYSQEPDKFFGKIFDYNYHSSNQEDDIGFSIKFNKTGYRLLLKINLIESKKYYNILIKSELLQAST